MKRTEIREQIFKLLFRKEFNEESEMPEQVRLFFEYPSSFEEVAYKQGEDEDNTEIITETTVKDILIKDKDQEYINNKYDSIIEKLPEIDEIINKTAKGWTVERLGKVDLTVLRLAIYEMKFDDDIPVSVAIDEAVELAKKFGQDESGSFINGVLSGVSKQD